MEAGAFQGSPSPRNTPPPPRLLPIKLLLKRWPGAGPGRCGGGAWAARGRAWAAWGGGAWAAWRGRSLGGAGRGLTEGDRCAAAAVCGGAAARAGRRPAMIASCLCYLLLPAARLFRSLSGTGLASRGAGSWGCALWRRRRGGGSAGPWGGGSGRASHPLAARSAGGQQVWRWWLFEPRSAGRSGPTRLGLAGDSRGQPLLTLWSGDVGPTVNVDPGLGQGAPSWAVAVVLGQAETLPGGRERWQPRTGEDQTSRQVESGSGVP